MLVHLLSYEMQIAEEVERAAEGACLHGIGIGLQPPAGIA
jgi:hypothetical protein